MFVGPEELRRQEEERKRLEAERLAREEAERKRRAAELAQLAQEHEEDAPTEASRLERLTAIMKAAAEKEEWERYLACSHRPDPSKETDMNTFLSEQNNVEDAALPSALETCQYTSEIIAELDAVAALALENGDTERVEVCNNFRRKLFDLVTDKQDRATAAWLQNARTYATRAAPFEARTSSEVGTLKYGLWVNLGLKNIRVKNITFKDLGIIVDITKPLAVQRVAFRAIHQQYDDARSRAQLVKERAAAFKGLAEAENTTARPHTRATRSGRGSKNASSTAAAEESKGAEGSGAGGGGGAGVGAAVPRDYAVGGVIYVEMLALPGQPKAVNKWTLHQRECGGGRGG